MGKLADALKTYRHTLKMVIAAKLTKQKIELGKKLTKDFESLIETYLDNDFSYDNDDQMADQWLKDHAEE